MRYSQISAYNKCQQYYKNVYVDKLPSGAPDSAALLFGSACHLGIETIFEKGDGEAVFEAAWEGHKDRAMEFSNGESWDTLNRDGVVLLSKFRRLHAKHIEPQYVESKLSKAYKDVVFTGTVDLAGTYKGVKSVIDFKTSAWPYLPEKLVVNEQLPLYNYMLRPEFEATQHVYFVLKKSKYGVDAGIQVLTREFTESEVISRVENAYNTVKDIEVKSVFTKNPNSCLMGKFKCNFYSNCWGEK